MVSHGAPASTVTGEAVLNLAHHRVSKQKEHEEDLYALSSPSQPTEGQSQSDPNLTLGL